MQRKVYSREPDLVMEAIEKLDSGILPVPQEETQATIYSKVRTPEDSRIDPDEKLGNLINHIRACDPDDFPRFFPSWGKSMRTTLAPK